ncbi:filamentous hemagglutinin N-terminal domain-containing protein [Rhodoferax sp.]|uniref:two-partner secretion domain-containing protein n=1 Tax=Rhodoferax sp. TaxID=50421 RepID=UPI0037847438
MVAVAEHTRGGSVAGSASGSRTSGELPCAGGLRLCALAVACVWGAASLPAVANPTGAVVVHGQATQTTNGNQLTVVTQNGAGTKHSAIDWQSFSIPKGSSTYFQQPDANSTVINRVVTNTPSLLFGNLGSNGHVVLVNHTGVTVGAGATVDAAGFTASALHMSDADALAGRLRFGSATASGGNVSVQGSVLARSGDVVLIGRQVATGADALVRSPNGSTVLAAGQQVELTGRGLEGISMLVQAPTDSALNLGTLQGDAVGVFAGTLKTTGSVAATAVSTEGGKVVLKAADRAEVGGSVSGLGLAGRGGQVHVTADKVAVLGDALIDVSGERGGGEALIGGGYKGQDARLANARRTSVQAGANIRADALGSGNGGTVVVWSDQATQFMGAVSARGGLLGGNGGLAEVSGKQFLDFQGKADLRAPAGKTGTLLLDPTDLLISNEFIDGYGGETVSGDIAKDDSFPSFITASSLSGLLANTNVSLAATNDIFVNSPVTGHHDLTLDAGNAVHLNAGINLTQDPNASTDPNGYGSPVISPELSLTAGAGGIVGGAGVIEVDTLKIKSDGDVLFNVHDVMSGPLVRVKNLHFVSTTGHRPRLVFHNLGNLNLLSGTSFAGEVDIDVVDGSLQVAGDVNVGSPSQPAQSQPSNVSLQASHDIIVNAPVTGHRDLTLRAGYGIRLDADINLSAAPDGYGSPVISPELNLHAGSGGIVGGNGVITVNQLNISSSGGVSLGRVSGVYHQVNNLEVPISGPGFSLQFGNQKSLVVHNIDSSSHNSGNVEIDVSGGDLDIAGVVDVTYSNESRYVLLSASGDISQSTGTIKAGYLEASATNITLTGYGNSVTLARFSANKESGEIKFSNNRNIEFADVFGHELKLENVRGNVTQSHWASMQVVKADFDVTGDITLESESNRFRDLTIHKAGAVQLNSNGLPPSPDGGDHVSFAQFTAPPPPEDLTLRQSNAESFDLVSNGDVLLLSSVTATAGSVKVETTGGSIYMNDGAGSITATGGTIALKATADVRLGNLNSTSTGDAISVSTGGDVLSFGNLKATAGNVRIETTNGIINTVGTTNRQIEAGGSISLQATKDLTLGYLKSSATGEAISLRTGGDIVFHADSGHLAASAGSVKVETTGGSINMAGPGGAGSITAAGGITVKATADVRLGNLKSESTGDISVETAGNIGSADNLTADAGKVILKTTGGGITVDVVNGVAKSITASGAITVEAKDAVSLGNLDSKSTGDAISVVAGGSIVSAGNLKAGKGNVKVETTGGQIDTTDRDIQAGGSITLKATQGLTLGYLESSATGDAISLFTAGGDVVFHPNKGDLAAPQGNVRVETTNGRINMVGVNGGAKSITAKGSISLKATSGLTLGALRSDAAGDAVTLVPYKSSNNGGEHAANQGFDAQNGSIDLTGSGRWLVYLAMENCDCNRPTINLGNLQANFKQYDAVYGDAVLGSGNGVMDGYNGTLWNMQLSGQTSKVYDGERAIGFAGLSFVSSHNNSPVPQTNGTDDDLSQALLVGATVQLDDPDVGTGKVVRLTRPVFSGVRDVKTDNIMTVYYGDSDVSGPVGVVLPATPDKGPPPQVPSEAPSPIQWLQQQPYGNSGAIIDSYLSNQPTAWQSPLVPTDPVFGQRDRANEGVLVEGEICVR